MPATANNKPRDAALDGVRGIAIVLVLFHHHVYYSGIDRRFWYDLQFFKLADSCWLGVDLFFVLSGFLITGILYDAKSSSHYFRSFYGRRVLRIFPLYFGFLLVALLVLPFWLSEEATRFFYQSQVWYWSFLANIHIAMEGWQRPVSHFWSLAIEEQFYLIWPFLVFAFDRNRLLHLTVYCMIIALVLRIWLPFGLDRTGAYVLLPTRMDCLAAGAFLALFIRGPGGIRSLGWLPWVLAICSTLSLAAIYLEDRRLSILDPVVATIGYTLIAVCFASWLAIVVAAPTHSWIRRFLSGAQLVGLGKYSYGLYVIHAPVIWFLQQGGLRADNFPRFLGSTMPGVIVFSLIGITISVVLAMASYHYWELPFLRLKRYLPYGNASKLKQDTIGPVSQQPVSEKSDSP